MEKEVMHWKKIKDGYIEEFGGRKGKEETCNYTIISKIKYRFFMSKYSFFQKNFLNT